MSIPISLFIYTSACVLIHSVQSGVGVGHTKDRTRRTRLSRRGGYPWVTRTISIDLSINLFLDLYLCISLSICSRPHTRGASRRRRRPFRVGLTREPLTLMADYLGKFDSHRQRSSVRLSPRAASAAAAAYGGKTGGGGR